MVVSAFGSRVLISQAFWNFWSAELGDGMASVALSLYICGHLLHSSWELIELACARAGPSLDVPGGLGPVSGGQKGSKSCTQSPCAITAVAAKLPNVEDMPGEHPQKGNMPWLFAGEEGPGYGNAVWKVSG